MAYKKIPPFLKKQIDNGKCVLFIGAGLSIGAGLPSWDDLIRPGGKRVGRSLLPHIGHHDSVQYGFGL